ncbi:hypothetical protein EHS39_36610 [Ensifer sp. MPMI2T]|nr:hypothetical protein EHS39_36610 [Ensifer sp. MPMI2T]
MSNHLLHALAELPVLQLVSAKHNGRRSHARAREVANDQNDKHVETRMMQELGTFRRLDTSNAGVQVPVVE